MAIIISDHSDLPQLLQQIPASSCDYDEWVGVGMALHRDYPGDGLTVWDSWSAADTARYHDGECAKKWESFDATDDDGHGAGYIGMLAKARGVALGRSDTSDAYALDTNTPIVISGPVEPRQLPTTTMEPWQQCVAQLETLYEPQEYIVYEVSTWETSDGRTAMGAGVGGRTCEQICGELRHYKNLDWALGTVSAAGAWVRINPCTGASDADVLAYRYALVESDNMPIEEQYALLHSLQLPIATIVHSGGKSLHAAVRIDAANKEIYRSRVRRLQEYCEANGLTLDRACANPSRYTRLAGAMRGDVMQQLVETNVGPRSWEEFETILADAADDLPEWRTLEDMRRDPALVQEPEVIEGILRQGQIGLIGAAPKSGKTWLNYQLAVAVATGGTWLGHQCHRGRVLVVDPELQEADILSRIDAVTRQEGVTDTHGNLLVWSLRGLLTDVSQLAPRIIRRAQSCHIDLILCDSIYTQMFMEPGDSENDTRTVLKMFAYLNNIARETGAAVIASHHFNKSSTAQGFDRFSGSGTWTRYPDACMILEPLVADPAQLRSVCDDSAARRVTAALEARGIPAPTMSADALAAYAHEQLPQSVAQRLEDDLRALVQGTHVRAMRASWILRSFADMAPDNLFYTGTQHIRDTRGILDGCEIDRGGHSNDGSGRTQATKAEQDGADMAYAFSMFADDQGRAPIADIAQYLQVDARTVKNRVDKMPGFKRERGYVVAVAAA